jgi:hopanoid biosynthesis associated radical SAM protein HpnH
MLARAPACSLSNRLGANMSIPLHQQIRIGAYVLKQKLLRRKRYPLVLMLEPLFRCNLACPGCGKIDYPDKILNARLSVQDCVAAAEECGAPVVSIAGGEPLLHKEIGEIVARLVAHKRYVYLCTNALLLEKKLEQFHPSRFLTFSVHLDGLEDEHDLAVAQSGTFRRAVSAIRSAQARGFRVSVNCTLFDRADPDRVARFFDYACGELGIDGITISPGYAYERAPDQEHFLTRQRTKKLFREIFLRGRSRRWCFNQSTLFLDFLAGNQDFRCTPWSNPTRNIFGWQRPCYLLNEGYAPSFRALMEETNWDGYGTGVYEKCANCMAHCGYEGTAVEHSLRRPWDALRVRLTGIRTEGPMAPDAMDDRPMSAEHAEHLVKRTRMEAAFDKPGRRESAIAVRQNPGRAPNHTPQ